MKSSYISSFQYLNTGIITIPYLWIWSLLFSGNWQSSFKATAIKFHCDHLGFSWFPSIWLDTYWSLLVWKCMTFRSYTFPQLIFWLFRNLNFWSFCFGLFFPFLNFSFKLWCPPSISFCVFMLSFLDFLNFLSQKYS